MRERTDWILDRHEARATGGMVAAKHPLAAEVGADVLRRGGNAVDAAVATAFAVGVVEPFMSGIGGGGYMLVHLADRGETSVVDYMMVAPRAATAGMYRLVGGTDQSLFGWPALEAHSPTVGLTSPETATWKCLIEAGVSTSGMGDSDCGDQQNPEATFLAAVPAAKSDLTSEQTKNFR
jgi:hypothetical protein